MYSKRHQPNRVETEKQGRARAYPKNHESYDHMPTVTKKSTENTTEQDIREILETSNEVTFTVSDFESLSAHTTALYFNGFEACAYRARGIHLINVTSRLMTDDDYSVEVENLDSWSRYYTITKNA